MVMTRNGLAAAGQLVVEDLRNLPGTFTTTNASTSVTATLDQRPYLNVGDLIAFSGDAATIYGIAAISSDGLTLTLVTAKNATGNGAGQTATKENFVIPDGTATSPQAAAGAGTASITAGTNTVTGSSTAFDTLFTAGDAIELGGEIHIIRAIASATSLTLETNHVAGAAGGSTYRKSTFTNRWGRFGAIACGTSTGTEAAGNNGLGTELTTGGMARRSGANVNTAVQNPSANTWRSRFETTFTVAVASQAVNEIAIYNSATAFRGICAVRQVFASQLNLVLNDLLTIVLSVDNTSATSSPSGGGSGVCVDIGLIEAAKLFMDTGTTRQANGAFSLGASDWAASTTGAQGTRFDSVALGTQASPALAKTDVTLQAETTSVGAGRITGDSGGPAIVNQGVMGTIMQTPTGNPPSFNGVADGSTVFAGDTVQWRAAFSITGTIGITEQGVFNGVKVGGGNGTNGDPGGTPDGSRMFIREIFGATYNLVNNDTHVSVIRCQQL